MQQCQGAKSAPTTARDSPNPDCQRRWAPVSETEGKRPTPHCIGLPGEAGAHSIWVGEAERETRRDIVTDSKNGVGRAVRLDLLDTRMAPSRNWSAIRRRARSSSMSTSSLCTGMQATLAGREVRPKRGLIAPPTWTIPTASISGRFVCLTPLGRLESAISARSVPLGAVYSWGQSGISVAGIGSHWGSFLSSSSGG